MLESPTLSSLQRAANDFLETLEDYQLFDVKLVTDRIDWACCITYKGIREDYYDNKEEGTKEKEDSTLTPIEEIKTKKPHKRMFKQAIKF